MFFICLLIHKPQSKSKAKAKTQTQTQIKKTRIIKNKSGCYNKENNVNSTTRLFIFTTKQGNAKQSKAKHKTGCYN